MAFLVETGVVVEGARSYVTVAEADSYHTDLANAGWAGTDQAKQAALIKASQYIDGKYRNQWKGLKVSNLQPLCWPRVGVIIDDAPSNYILGGGYVSTLPYNIIPQQLKDAVCEAAIRSLTGVLAKDIDASVESVQVGPIKTTYKASKSKGVIRYQIIDQLLSALTESGNGLVRG